MVERRDRLVRALEMLLQFLRVGNVIGTALIAAMLIASIPAAGMVEARLAAKYGARADPATVLHFMQALFLLCLPAAYVVERLLGALDAMLRTIATGEPFSAANAGRLRTIGWMLLNWQLLDLLLGVAAGVARIIHIDFITWQPSFTGWIAVLVAFVLARVFTDGAAMRDELEGTV